MNTLRSTTAFLSLVSALAAQQDTSPAGYLATEGNSSNYSTFGYTGGTNTQNTYYGMVDNTHAGGGSHVIRALTFRRDGTTPTDLTIVPRTVTMTIRMAHGNYSQIANNATNPEANYLTSAWVNVFTPKQVVLPNWSMQPFGGGLASFNLTFPLDVAFPYTGAGALVYQFKCSPNNLGTDRTPFPIDSVSYAPYTSGAQTPIGAGCIATGKSVPVGHDSYLRNCGSPGNSTWQMVTSNAPGNAPMVVVIGRSNPDLLVGACERLYAQPNLVLAGGATDSSGWGSFMFDFPHQPVYVGASFFTQILTYDAGQPGVPFAFSRGIRATYPADPVFPLASAGGLVWTTGQAFPTGFRYYKGASLVIGLGY